LQCLELWILENKGQRHSLRRASELTITGLAATAAQSGLIASASNDYVVKINEVIVLVNVLLFGVNSSPTSVFRIC
jgi:hypothetical protein